MYSYLVFLLVISYLLVNNCNALGGGRKILGKDYTTFDVHSFLSNSCKTSLQGRTRHASLKVTYRYGHCSTSGLNNTSYIEPNLAEIVARDQIRAASIHNKRQGFSAKSNIDEEELGVSKATTLSAQPNGGAYVVSVGLGTPAKDLTLIFDTGSSLTWTQCQPCVAHCYQQKDMIFNPSTSTSYSNASCDSTQCSKLTSVPYYTRGCTQESTCHYGGTYGDNSYTNGYLANERLTLTPNDVLDNFPIGCGENNTGFGDGVDGILGLGRDYFSVVSQTAGKYGNYFSYCLPTPSGSNGHLTFGKDNVGAPGNLVFTPLVNDPNGEFYIVNTVAINIGAAQIAFRSGSGGLETVIDSGTTFTQLPPVIYAQFRDAFRQQMSQYTLVHPFKAAQPDTCYDFSNNSKVSFPIISFIFEGNAKIDLDFKGTLIQAGQPAVFCLAFVAAQSVTLGNVQQQTFDVVYDVSGGRLGFAPGGCS